MDYEYDDDDERLSKPGCCRNIKTHFILWSVLGAIALAFGLAAKPAVNSIMVKTIEKDVTLKSTQSQLYPIWTNSSKVPMYMTFWMWNLTNPDAVLTGAKPHVELIGPFDYQEIRLKDDIGWSTDGTRVHYTYSRNFYKLKNKCKSGVLYPTEPCSLDDSMLMTTANIPLMQIVGLVGQLANAPNTSNFVRNLLIDAIQGIANSNNETIFMQRPVKEVIWGYKDPMITEINTALVGILDALNISAAGLGLPLPEIVRIQENNPLTTRTNQSEIYTGSGNIENIFTFTKWTGYEGHTDTWAGSKCPNTTQGQEYIKWANMINGTEALSFRPNLKPGDSLYVFSDDLHRASRLVHTDTVKTKGIETFRFTIAPDNLRNASEVPWMCAFDAYQPTGTLNLEAFTGGPVYASKHHFLDADPIYLSMVSGVSPPERDLHDTTLDIEPHTGSSFNVHQRLQINVQMQRVDGFKQFQDLQDGGFYLPVTKVDEHGMVTDDLVNQWQSQVGVALKARDATHQVGIIGGSALLFLGLICGVAWYRNKHPAKIMLANGMDESMPLLD
eukprot:TRINITY_DN5498_c0_g1_i2.p1 TRINITY_DN5498_c0_g1~~TRINITY_DN5498_c0_g1_i2.p1  ORF type:complete len:557 (+),score=145.85 TRINITY_DN5498_c0_g1_i2:140-1810(+)